MRALQQLENKLNNVFGKNLPPLPANGKKALVQWLPWINLILGILALWAAIVLYQAATATDDIIDYASSLSAASGGPTVDGDNLTTMVWLGLIFLAVEALLYLAAFPATRERKKSGWNLMFYALLINVVYGVVVLFTEYGGVGSFLGSLIGSAIGLYLLFQIRDSYRSSPAK